jgi:hypothetical protein
MRLIAIVTWKLTISKVALMTRHVSLGVSVIESDVRVNTHFSMQLGTDSRLTDCGHTGSVAVNGSGWIFTSACDQYFTE